MPLNLHGAYRHIQPNTQPCWSRLSCHLNSLVTHPHGVASDQFDSHMTQYLGVISQSRLSLAMSHVYTYVSVPSCTSIIKLSILSILNNHTLLYQPNISTMTFHIKLSQGSDLSLQQDTNLLQRKKNLNNLGFPTRTNSLQRKPHTLQRVLSVSAKQSINSKLNLLFTIRAFSLRWEPYSLQRVL